MTRASKSARPIVRLWSVASSCIDMLPSLGCANTSDLIELVQDAVGNRYRVTADARQIEAAEIDDHGGRRDDRARALEIQKTLADDRIAAAVALRGGAWLTRILPLVDFNVLQARRNRLAVFGFSELTPLLNIVARYPSVFAYYDLCPGFLRVGMTNYAREHVSTLSRRTLTTPAAIESFAKRWASDRFVDEFTAFFRDVVDIIEGRGSRRSIVTRCVDSTIEEPITIKVVGGNLTTLITLLGSRHKRALSPTGRWLVIEDIRERPERVDRMLAHLTLSGMLTCYDGIVVGVFYRRAGDCTDATLQCLKHHLAKTHCPIITTKDVGHVWPIAPLPINRSFKLTPVSSPRGELSAEISWSRWRIV